MARKIDRMTPIPLSCIRDADIGAAQRSPPCGPDSAVLMVGEIDAADIGRVRMTFKKANGKRHRTRRWLWVAERADFVREHACDSKGPCNRVVDDSRDAPIMGIYPMCSVCGAPQVSPTFTTPVR